MADKRKGYVLFFRSIWDNPVLNGERFDSITAFMYLVSHANYKKGSIRTAKGVVDVERSQLHTTIRHLSLIFQWDPKTVMRFLQKLENAGMITQTKSIQGTTLTIVNYNKYQDLGDSDIEKGNEESNKAWNKPRNKAGNTDSTLLNTNNNTEINTSINTSKNKAPAWRGGWEVVEK